MTGASGTELLDAAAMLSMRALSFGDSLEDVGHQCLRASLGGLYERTKDGIATCSVLTHAILMQTAPLLAYGHHPVSLQRDIRLAHEFARECLRRRAWVIDDPDETADVIRTANLPSEVAVMVAEIFDTIGSEGALLVEETRHLGIASEYIRGGRWSHGVASPNFLGQEPNQVIVRAPSILVTDQPMETIPEAVAVLDAASGSRSLVLIAPAFSDAVVALLLANQTHGGIESIIAVKAPLSVQSGSQQLDDIALMTGGRFLPRDDPHALQSVSPSDLGHAERAWASRSAFGIVGGAGDVRAINQRVAGLRALARIEDDPVRKTHLSVRAGNLAGLSALVRVGSGARGGPTAREIERAAATARAALDSGVVEGGGVALARAGQAVARDFRGSEHEVGAMALSRALAVPMAKIIEQTGRESGPLINCLSTNNEVVFDVLKNRWVNAREAGLADPLTVVEGALDVAVGTASMVLSTDVVIGRRSG